MAEGQEKSLPVPERRIALAVIGLLAVLLGASETARFLDNRETTRLNAALAETKRTADAALEAVIEPSVLILGFELIIVALLVYYIKMVGYHRMRIAFGGVSLGLGAFIAYMAYLVGTNSILQGVPQETVTLAFGFLLFISVIQILAGILNLLAADR